MKYCSIFRIFASLVVTVFLCVQIGGSAHGLQLDNENHHDDCVYCHVVSEKSDVQVILLPVSGFAELAVFQPKDDVTPSYNTVWELTPPGRAPPPRGPPAIFI